MIPIQNIYYMLSYAFQVLNEQGYKKIATESFQNAADLCAAILAKGVASQLKRGLGKEYVEQSESLSTIKGRIEITDSIKARSIHNKQLVCSYDIFSVNSYMNRVIKTTLEILSRVDISKSRKKELRKLLVYFADVDTLNVHCINWNQQYNRNNQTYRMLAAVCYLVIKGLLQTNSDGNTKLMDFVDEQRMSRLYEKFILEYYIKEFPQLKVTASQIPWIVDDDYKTMLPIMQTDIMLEHRGKVLIIDAKYYSHNTQTQFDVHTMHSSNLYQIFTYVKNKEAELKNVPHEVSGMLLYARTDELIQPENVYHMSGNKISVSTLDLNCDFNDIKGKLNRIVEDHFAIEH